MSIKKLLANQANAQKSTGPRTPRGKRISSANAVSHGLFAKSTPVRDEDQPGFQAFTKKVHEDLQPQGPTETYYVEHFVDQWWRLRACLGLETALIEYYRVYKGAKGDVGVAFSHDASQLGCLNRLSRYAPGFERGLAKDLADLRKLQATRHKVLAPGQDETVEPGPDSGPASSPGQDSATEHAQTPAPQEPPPSAKPGSDCQLAWFPSLGTLSGHLLLSDEDPNQFHNYSQSLFAEWEPRGAVKALFVELFAATSWRLARLSKIEAGLFEQYRLQENVDGGALMAFVQDAFEMDCFGKLAQIERAIRDSLSKTLKELLK